MSLATQHEYEHIGESAGIADHDHDLVAELADHDLHAVIETVSDRGLHRVILQGILTEEIPGYRERLAVIGFSNVLVREK